MEFRADSTMRLDEAEADLLRGLTAEMETLLTTEGGEGDAVVDRLFPDAYESPEDESTFREMVGDDLHRHKVEALAEVRDALGKRGAASIRFSDGDPGTWLTVLTDLRLAIGTTLGVTEETMSQDLDLDQSTNQPLLVLHWLGWVQESILREIT
jgi:hypothetical protein